MQWNEEAEEIMRERFGGDNEMALATCRGSVPSVRTVNATYWEGCFYIITYDLSRAHLRQAFASWIDNGHNDFSDENTIILQVRVTDALLLSHGRRFEK